MLEVQIALCQSHEFFNQIFLPPQESKTRLPLFEYTARILSISSDTQKVLSSQTSSALSDNLLSLKADIPGGIPFSLCEISRSTDFFNIRSVELTKQPVYTHADDEFIVHLYGSFQGSFSPNATLDLTVDCGSHCEEYGFPPGERQGETTTEKFCEMSEIEQPLGGKKKNTTCPPKEGYALISSWGFVMPMFFSNPGWYNFTFDAKTTEGRRIYCLTAPLKMGR
ncbi:hypothetical protein F5Y19DRAFT_493544 [Xylariaceae sp. FL1651]|nr:hypothetical protein F5Y19DRAFT_493544 [Xylariaceae sp. FL1651]